jgi:hypothetical protein
MKNLHSTGVPLPFQCFYAARVANAFKVEQAIFEDFGDFRVSKAREFLQIAPHRVRAILQLLVVEEVTPCEEVVDGARELQEMVDVQARKKSGRFRFSRPVRANNRYGAISLIST